MNELAKESGDAPDAAYGLRQSLATAGALIGSTIASLVFVLSGHNYVATFAAASFPPIIALLWLVGSFKDELVAGGAGKGVKAKGGAADGPKLSLLGKVCFLGFGGCRRRAPNHQTRARLPLLT